MSNELMLELTRAWMKEMKIDSENTQWSLTRHNNTKHPHGHLIINRVDNDGATISDQHNYRNGVESCRKLEKQYGLVDAKEAGQDNRRAKGAKLPARDAAKLYIQDSESGHKPHAASVEELLAAMKQDGIKVQTKLQGGKLQSVVYEYQGHFIKGSELGRESSGSGLVKTIDAQRETVLARRGAVELVGAPGIQLGAELESFGQQVGAQLQANDKAEKQELEQKRRQEEQTKREAQEQTKREAEEKAAQREAAQKQADEKAREQTQRELARGIQPPTPTIEKSGEIEM